MVERAQYTIRTSIQNMGINLCGGNITVSKQLLNCPEIVTALHQTGGKIVVEGVARTVFVYVLVRPSMENFSVFRRIQGVHQCT